MLLFVWLVGVAGAWEPADGGVPKGDAALVRHDLAACRSVGTFVSRTGIERMRWDVVRTCMESRGWVEDGRPVVSVLDPRVRLACQLGSVVLGPEGEPRLDRRAERRCLAEPPATTLASDR